MDFLAGPLTSVIKDLAVSVCRAKDLKCKNYNQGRAHKHFSSRKKELTLQLTSFQATAAIVHSAVGIVLLTFFVFMFVILI